MIVVVVACTGCATGQTGDPTEASDDTVITLGHVVSDAGGEVEFWIEYGLTKAYGSEGFHQTASVAKNTATEVTAGFEGLTRSTTYHYRLCAQDGSQQGGPGCGEDRTATTQSFGCGDTVTTDVKFTTNVGCQMAPVNDPGLVIGAPGIEIDMRGFDMFGPIFIGGGTAGAIDNSGGFDDVTIRDGRVGNFGDGIHLEDASRNRILHMQAFGSDGIEINGGSDNEIRHSNLFGRGAGLVATDTIGLIVADSQANGNFGSGMVLSGLVGSRIVRSTAPNGGNACCTTSGMVLTASSDNVIKDNRVGGWNGGNIKLVSGANNKLLGNEVFDGFLSTIAPGGFDSEADGIFIGAFTASTIVRGNHAHDNDGDGIEVQGAGTRITDNTADGNGDFGIDAVAGVTDGGGNSASGNGNPLQCRNVFCG